MRDKFTLGIDYGSDSVRALIVDALSGEEKASHVCWYTRWKEGRYSDSAVNRFRQHPIDYVNGLETAVREALSKVNGSSGKICGIAVDTTGSTPVPVDKKGTPLSLLPEFSENPNAMFILWKDHCALAEAEEINLHRKSIEYLKYEGGIYSSEWFWAKILHILRTDEAVRAAAWSWVEHCDWIPALLTGNTDPLLLKRSRCAAGHKAMWHKDWNGLPPDKFLSGIDVHLSGLRDRLYRETYTSDVCAGNLCSEWARRLGLPVGIPVSVGAFDAHMGAVGGGIEPFWLSKVMGTSTCDMLVVPHNAVGKKLIKGICGQVDGSIIPEMTGLEAGQSAFGDIFAWFKNILSWPLNHIKSPAGTEEKFCKVMEEIIPELEKEAAAMKPGDGGITGIDWHNGRRTPDANQKLKGAIFGLSLGSSAPMIYRALVESAVFGARRIFERFAKEGIQIVGVNALGGVAKKSPLVMQIMTDVLGVPIRVVRSEQACALGAAMFAAVTAGIHTDIPTAMKNMSGGFEKTYVPDVSLKNEYDRLYLKYCKYGAFIEQDTMNSSDE